MNATHSAENDARAEDVLVELIAVHTPDLVRLALDGISDGQHYYCVECGVVPADEAGAAHVARVILTAGFTRALPPATGERP